MNAAAVIVAAGSGTRIGFDKLLAELAGEPVILHTLRAFQRCGEIRSIVVVAGEERAAIIRGLAERGEISKLHAIVPGGSERHFSVWNGLQAVPPDTDLVAVHDGARPLIAPAQISRCVARAAECGAAACARPVPDTMKRADAAGMVTGSVPRDGLWAMETPQVFRLDLLRAAYTTVLADGALVTDEVSAVEHAGCPVWLVENRTPNPKITYPGDLEMAARLL